MAEALKTAIKYAISEDHRKFIEYVEEEKADREAWGRVVFANGEAKGRAEGESKAQRKFAQKLIADGFKHDKIAQLTGLSASEAQKVAYGSGNS